MRISDWSSDVCSSDLLTSNDSPACKVSAVWPSQVSIATVFGAPRKVIRTVCLPLTTIERSDSVCGQIGTSVNARSEEHTSELQSLMRITYAVFCLKKKRAKNKREHS